MKQSFPVCVCQSVCGPEVRLDDAGVLCCVWWCPSCDHAVGPSHVVDGTYRTLEPEDMSDQQFQALFQDGLRRQVKPSKGVTQ